MPLIPLFFSACRRLLATLALSALGAGLVYAAPPPGTFTTANATVMVDGIPLGQGGVGSHALNHSVAFDNGLYHLWYTRRSSRMLDDIARATSTDGVNFTSVPGSDFAPPANWWTDTFYGLTATTENRATWFRVSKQGSDWILSVWHQNSTPAGNYRPYNYNTSLWNIGPDITNTAITLIGPLPLGSTTPRGPGDHVGNAGIVNNNLYLIHPAPNSLGRYGLAAAPATSPTGVNNVADLYEGTPWCRTGTPPCAAVPANRSYVDNVARTVDQGSTLGTYFSFRHFSTTARREKQLYYTESSDDGESWSTSETVFANGDLVTVDGLLNTGAFATPEIVPLGGGAFRGYFSTADACGRFVVVTAAPATAATGLTITKAFEPTVVPVGGESALTITLSAPPATCSPAPGGSQYSDITFTDNLPTGLSVASLGANACGGTLTATTGSGTVSLSGVSLTAGQSCTTTVNVKVEQAGVFNNVIYASPDAGDGGVTTAERISALASASATLSTPAVGATPVPTLGQWSLLLLSLLAGGWGALRLRGRRA